MITSSYAYLDLTAEELADLRMLQSYSAKPVNFLGLRYRAHSAAYAAAWNNANVGLA